MPLDLLRQQRLFRPRLTHVSAALLACLAVGSTLAAAAVHIRLESSVPAAGEVVSSAPERFELRFSGPVNAGLSSLALVAPSGDSVGVVLEVSFDDGRVLVGDVPELTAGEYRVLWTTVSADGHPVSGEFSFTYAGAPAVADVPAAEAGDETAEPGHPAAASAESSATDRSSPEPSPSAGIVLLAGLGMACLLGFAGLLWYCGSSTILREPRIGRATTLLGWAALLLLGAQQLAWTVSVVPTGAGFTGVTATLGSATGVAGLSRLLLVLVALVALPRYGRVSAGLALSAVVVGAMSGHAVTISPWITMPAKIVHLGAASVWLGGLLLLVLAPDGPEDGSDAWHFGALVRAVSGAALLSVVLIAASGIIQSARLVGDLSAYWGTPYGRGVLAKWAGLLVLIGFGAFHRFRAIPKLEPAAGGRGLRRTVRLETIVMLAVVMLAAWLARVPPPAGH
ncbi:MAG: copper resistance protein CopC [Gemmatimonadota bacterium]